MKEIVPGRKNLPFFYKGSVWCHQAVKTILRGGLFWMCLRCWRWVLHCQWHSCFLFFSGKFSLLPLLFRCITLLIGRVPGSGYYCSAGFCRIFWNIYRAKRAQCNCFLNGHGMESRISGSYFLHGSSTDTCKIPDGFPGSSKRRPTT